MLVWALPGTEQKATNFAFEPKPIAGGLGGTSETSHLGTRKLAMLNLKLAQTLAKQLRSSTEVQAEL